MQGVEGEPGQVHPARRTYGGQRDVRARDQGHGRARDRRWVAAALTVARTSPDVLVRSSIVNPPPTLATGTAR